MKKPRTRSEPASKSMLSPLLSVFGATFGEQLTGLVSHLGLPEYKELRDALRGGHLALTLNEAGAYDASIVVTVDLDDGNSTQRREEIIYRHPAGKPVAVGLQRQVTVPFTVIETMADLAAHTREHKEQKAEKVALKLKQKSRFRAA
jgi:hypothetical protein